VTGIFNVFNVRYQFEFHASYFIWLFLRSQCAKRCITMWKRCITMRKPCKGKLFLASL